MYLFDTDTFSNAFEPGRKYPELAKRILQEDSANLSISVVMVEEYLGKLLPRIQEDWNKPRIVERYAALQQFIATINRFTVLSYDDDALQAFATMPDICKKHHPRDCRVAAIALSRKLIVVTRNTRHFEKIPGVVFEDWTAG